MSNLEFQGEPMTRREVLIARHAFIRGSTRNGSGRIWSMSQAAYEYPLTVTRPRVVAVEDQTEQNEALRAALHTAEDPKP